MEFNKKENSLDPVCSNDICIFEDMFIGGTALLKNNEEFKRSNVKSLSNF